MSVITKNIASNLKEKKKKAIKKDDNKQTNENQ